MSTVYSKEKPSIVRLLIELSNHKSSSVQLEIANSLSEITSNPNSIKIAIVLYTNLLNEVKDNNCLIVILKSLFSLKSKFKSILEEHILSFVVLMSSNVSLESKQLAKQLVNELLCENNLVSVFDKFSCELHKQRSSAESDRDLRDIIIEIMFESIKKYPLKCLPYATKIIERCLFTKADSEKANENINIINSLFILYSPEYHFDFLNCIMESFNDISNIDILQSNIHLIAEFSVSSKQLIQFFDIIVRSLGTLMS
jgi:hypothetical protein